MEENESEPEILTTADLARITGLSVDHVRTLTRKHSIGRIIGLRLRAFSRADVERLRAVLATPQHGRPRDRYPKPEPSG